MPRFAPSHSRCSLYKCLFELQTHEIEYNAQSSEPLVMMPPIIGQRIMNAHMRSVQKSTHRFFSESKSTTMLAPHLLAILGRHRNCSQNLRCRQRHSRTEREHNAQRAVKRSRFWPREYKCCQKWKRRRHYCHLRNTSAIATRERPLW